MINQPKAVERNRVAVRIRGGLAVRLMGQARVPGLFFLIGAACDGFLRAAGGSFRFGGAGGAGAFCGRFNFGESSEGRLLNSIFDGLRKTTTFFGGITDECADGCTDECADRSGNSGAEDGTGGEAGGLFAQVEFGIDFVFS